MNEIRIITAILGCTLLVACSNDESEAKNAVLARLKDPDSVMFGKFTLIGENLGCLTVNAKNAFGGYTGDKQAFLKKEGGKWTYYLSDEISHESCIEMWPQVAPK